jgi:hypothetical protein
MVWDVIVEIGLESAIWATSIPLFYDCSYLIGDALLTFKELAWNKQKNGLTDED